MTKLDRVEAFFGFDQNLTFREYNAAWPRRLLACVICIAIGAAIAWTV